MSRQLSVIEQRIVWTRFRRETDKIVLRELARWFAFRADGTHVCPPSVDALAAKTKPYGVSYRTTERALQQRLGRAGYLKVTTQQNRGPTTYQIMLDRLATQDPEHLYVAGQVDRHNGGRMHGSTAKVADETDFDRQSGGRVADESLKNANDFEKVADENSVVVDLCTSTGTSSTTDEDGTGSSTSSSATMAADVAFVLAWWTANYPLRNGGARYTVNRHDATRLQDLLRTRSREHVLAMALALWAIESDGDPSCRSNRSWIASGERNIYILHHKANFLDRIVAGLEPQQLTFGPLDRAPLSQREIEEAQAIRTRSHGGCPHEPRCATTADCVEEIAFSRRTGTR